MQVQSPQKRKEERSREGKLESRVEKKEEQNKGEIGIKSESRV